MGAFGAGEYIPRRRDGQDELPLAGTRAVFGARFFAALRMTVVRSL